MEFDDVIEKIDGLLSDRGVPKNVRTGLINAKNILLDSSKLPKVRASLAIYELDRAINDINLAQHFRIKLMQLVSELEARNE